MEGKSRKEVHLSLQRKGWINKYVDSFEEKLNNKTDRL